MPAWLDATTLRCWAQAALTGLTQARSELDALNVFPVPDGDTGTNLVLTWQSAAAAVEELFTSDRDVAPSAATVAETLAGSALLGARGNSGVITSQILRGFAQVVRAEQKAPTGEAAALVAAFSQAARMAYQAVGDPKEGTILTVIRVAAESAATALAGADSQPAGSASGEPQPTAATVVRAALAGSRDALEHTPEQLPVLAAAGVVDAGGAGCVVLLAALTRAITGVVEAAEPLTGDPASVAGGVAQVAVRRRVEYSGPASEVMYLLDAADERVPALREQLSALGDSLVVVGGDGLWNVHVHVNDVGAAIEAGINAGRPHRIRVTNLGGDWVESRHPRQAGPEATLQGRALVAVVHGSGVAGLLTQAGIATVWAEPDHRPSTRELLDAATRTQAAEVVILPSDRDTRAVADAAAALARERGIRTAVIPTRSIVQTLAAVAVHDGQKLFDDDVVAMGREAGATRYGAVAVAVRQAATRAGECQPGDVIGLVDGDIEVVGRSLAHVAASVVGRLLRSGTELVTLVWGADAPADLKKTLQADLGKVRPDVELEVIDGGQPRWPLIVGAT